MNSGEVCKERNKVKFLMYLEEGRCLWHAALTINGLLKATVIMSKKKTRKIPHTELLVVPNDTFTSLKERNEKVVQKLFNEDPGKILVSIQIEEDQIEHLASGLTGRSRRLIPLPFFIKLIKELIHEDAKD